MRNLIFQDTKIMEQRIKDFDLFLNHFFHASNDCMCISGRDGYFKKVNPAFQRLLGEEEDSILSKPFLEFIHPEDRILTSNYVRDFFLGKTSSAIIENRYRTKSGDYRWLQWTTGALVNNEHIYAIAHDVTEQKKKDIAIMDTEMKLMHFIDLLPHPVFLKNQKSQYILVNQEQARLFSTGKEEIIGKEDSFFIDDPEELEIIKQSDQVVTRDKRTITLPEQVIRITNGKKRILHTTKMPFFSQLTGEVHILGVSIDLTEIKEAEKELKNINFELDSFVYHSSHDLRAPLCSLTGLLTLLKKDSSPDMKETCINEAIKTIDKLDHFISDLTDFSRNSRLELRSQTIDFNNIVNECCDDLKFMKGADKIFIQVAIQEDLIHISDRQRIKVIFMNLISNAIKYQHPEKARAFLSIEIMKANRQVVILFKDNGIGIEEKYRDKVFDMFFRASENSFGSGLGLYIVKQTVEKLKGSIQVISAPEEGTVFYMTLPELKNVV